MISSGATAAQIIVTIGIRIPNVPQDVPIAKASPPATRNTIAGIIAGGILDAATKPPTNSPVFKSSLHTPLIVHASVRIMKAPTIDFTPIPIPSINSLNVITLRGTKRRNATISAPNPASARALPASVFPKPSAMVIPPSKYPPT